MTVEFIIGIGLISNWLPVVTCPIVCLKSDNQPPSMVARWTMLTSQEHPNDTNSSRNSLLSSVLPLATDTVNTIITEASYKCQPHTEFRHVSISCLLERQLAFKAKIQS
jgi:hypothetical protein